ncbi:MAG: hypothetical protein ACLTSG_00845 [Lachnospiraceae bacterium]
MSTSNTYERRMIEAADIAILEINPNYPFVYGDHVVHCSEVDYLVEADYPVPVVPDIPLQREGHEHRAPHRRLRSGWGLHTARHRRHTQRRR